MASAVLDASAILALLQAEPGGERVAGLLLNAEQVVYISTLNWSEVLDRLLRHGTSAEDAERQIARLGMAVVDFDVEQARIAATYRILAPTLSLADRACLAVASVHRAAAWTADRFWSQCKLDVPIELIRT
jgi:PIN domain nuclease of toxin-antitoxin system